MRVLATGVFDLLHAEHVRFLAAAKNQITNSKLQVPNPEENYLIVGVESDKRVRELKGSNRPIILQDERLELVRAIKFVDEAFIIRRDAGSSRMRNAVNNVSRMEGQEKAATDGCETHSDANMRIHANDANADRKKQSEVLGCYKKLLLEINPDVYAVSENSPHLETKKLLCRETGVELRIVYPENAEVSTSKIIEKIRIM